MYSLFFGKSGKQQYDDFCWQYFSFKAFLIVANEENIIMVYILYTWGVFLRDRIVGQFTCSLGQERLT